MKNGSAFMIPGLADDKGLRLQLSGYFPAPNFI
jgi:hypothetical protein